MNGIRNEPKRRLPGVTMLGNNGYCSEGSLRDAGRTRGGGLQYSRYAASNTRTSSTSMSEREGFMLEGSDDVATEGGLRPMDEGWRWRGDVKSKGLV